MIQRRSKTCTPDHGVDRRFAPIWPDYSIWREGIERLDTVHHPSLTRNAHVWHHHDIAQPTRGYKDSPLMKRFEACGCSLEQHPAVDVIRKEVRRLEQRMLL